MRNKYSNEKVIEIRKMYLTGKFSITQLSKKEKMAQRTVRNILLNYDHVEEFRKEATSLFESKKINKNIFSHTEKNGVVVGVMTIFNSKGDSYEVLYDLEDEKRIKKHSWAIPPSAYRKYPRTNIDRKTCMLHRFLMNPSKNMVVDHVDDNPLNNLRENLRICTHSENQRNRGKPKSNSSGYIGVFIHNPKALSSFGANVVIDGKHHNIGNFYTGLLAAVAYDEYIKNIDDKYSVLNFPKGLSQEQKIQVEKDKQSKNNQIKQRKNNQIKQRMQRNLDKYNDIFKKLENIVELENPYSIRELCDMYVKKYNPARPQSKYLATRVWAMYRGEFLNKSKFLFLWNFVDIYKKEKRKHRKPIPKEIECKTCGKIMLANKKNFYFKNERPRHHACKKCIAEKYRLKYQERKKTKD